MVDSDSLPETNSKFAPENGWLEYDCFLLGPDLCSAIMFPGSPVNQTKWLVFRMIHGSQGFPILPMGKPFGPNGLPGC